MEALEKEIQKQFELWEIKGAIPQESFQPMIENIMKIIKKRTKGDSLINCNTCKYLLNSEFVYPCNNCLNFEKWEID